MIRYLKSLISKKKGKISVAPAQLCHSPGRLEEKAGSRELMGIMQCIVKHDGQSRESALS